MKRSKARPKFAGDEVALVAILKSPRDLVLAARDHWYRIPAAKAPRRAFTHIAFYQPDCFPEGKRIASYAEVAGRATVRRDELLPGEPGPGERLYVKFLLGPLIRLPRPILNTGGTRVCFGFTPLWRLYGAGELYSVFGIAPVENVMRSALGAAGLPFRREHVVMGRGRLAYRLDFALFCRRGRIDIECDGWRGHSGPRQRAWDARRDAWLKRRGWTVLRFGEHEVLYSVATCLREIGTAVRRLGGPKRRPPCGGSPVA
jgi:very-short-patch-repair endonuclease